MQIGCVVFKLMVGVCMVCRDYVSPHTLRMEMRLGFDLTNEAENEHTERAKG